MSDAAAKIAARLAELWQTSRPTILERMDVLRRASASLNRNPADAEVRGAGREAAHKLSGILGVFGLPEGSTIAAAIEEILQSPDALTAADLETLQKQVTALEAVIASKDGPGADGPERA